MQRTTAEREKEKRKSKRERERERERAAVLKSRLTWIIDVLSCKTTAIISALTGSGYSASELFLCSTLEPVGTRGRRRSKGSRVRGEGRQRDHLIRISPVGTLILLTNFSTLLFEQALFLFFFSFHLAREGKNEHFFFFFPCSKEAPRVSRSTPLFLFLSFSFSSLGTRSTCQCTHV